MRQEAPSNVSHHWVTVRGFKLFWIRGKRGLIGCKETSNSLHRWAGLGGACEEFCSVASLAQSRLLGSPLQTAWRLLFAPGAQGHFRSCPSVLHLSPEEQLEQIFSNREVAVLWPSFVSFSEPRELDLPILDDLLDRIFYDYNMCDYEKNNGNWER